MSGITRKLYTALLRANSPMTHSDLSPAFIAFPITALAALLSQKFKNGQLTRVIVDERFAYQLSDAMRQRLEAHGVDAVVRGASSGRSVAAQALRPQLRTDSGMPAWPAMNRGAPLRPAISSPLPWADEEELPPCVGERYRDALRPRPMDD
jgi:hypothetical protein